MIKRTVKNIIVLCSFNIGVNVIGIPDIFTHSYVKIKKELNIRQRYTY